MTTLCEIIQAATNAIASADGVRFAERRTMPAVSGMYFVHCGGKLLYVGISEDIRFRWLGHHRARQVCELDDARIFHLPMPHPLATQTESHVIASMKPAWNRRRVPRPFDAAQHARAVENIRQFIDDLFGDFASGQEVTR